MYAGTMCESQPESACKVRKHFEPHVLHAWNQTMRDTPTGWEADRLKVSIRCNWSKLCTEMKFSTVYP